MKKRIPLALIVIALIAGGIAYYFWNKGNNEKEYHQDLVTLLNDIELSIAESAIIGATYQKYWGDIIDRRLSVDSFRNELSLTADEVDIFLNYSNSDSYGYSGKSIKKGEFNTMIAIVAYAKTEDTTIALENSEKISQKLASLKNPPAKHESDYSAVLDLFEVYNTFVSISTEPIGSYIEYSRTLNSTYESVQSKLETTKVQVQ